MPRYSIFFIFLLISCTQAFMEETQDSVNIPITVSYDTSSIGISLEWKTQWDFNKTQIHRGTTPYNLTLYIVDSLNPSFLDVNSDPGKDYYYQVIAYNSKGRVIGQSAVVKGYRSYNTIDDVIAPSQLQASSYLSSDSIEFYWAGNVSDTYRIYRKKSTSAISVANGLDVPAGFEFHEEVNFNFNDELMYIDKDVQLGEVICYTVSAVGQNADKEISEKFASEIIKSTTKEAPEGVKASNGDSSIGGSIRVTWDYKHGDEYYTVYRATEENGEYYLINSFISENCYIDKSLLVTDGEMINGVYTYPKYYYRVTSGENSGFSKVAMGYAIPKKDIISYPNNFDAEFNTSDFSLTLTWAAPNGVTGKDYKYKLISIDDFDNTNVLLASTDATSFVVDMSPENSTTYSYYGKYYSYEVVAIDTSINIQGISSSVSYTHTIPGAVTITKASTNEIASIVTNIVTSPTTTMTVYYKSGGTTTSSNVGTIIEEWVTTTTGGYIDIEWTPFHALENISYYTLYRKLKDSGEEFKIVATDIEDTQYRDDNFTTEELSQGSVYQYKVIATDFTEQKGLEGSYADGRVLAPADILPAPDYLTIPAHWARKKKSTSWGRTIYSEIGFSSYTWTSGANSPQGADKISGLTQSGQHLYLVWGTVPNATKYSAKVNGKDISGQTSFTDTYTMVENFGNSDGETGFYYVTESWTGAMTDVSAETAEFSVGATSGIHGEERGITFKQIIMVE